MKLIYNRYIPLTGRMLNVCGVVFIRCGGKVTDLELNRQAIHTEQMKPLLGVFYYLWYGVEWLVKLPRYGSRARRNVSFVREAWENQSDPEYLNSRARFAWLDYL